MSTSGELSATGYGATAHDSGSAAERGTAAVRPAAGRSRFGLRSKLAAGVLAVSVAAVVGMGMATRLAFDRGFVDYLNARGTTQLETLQPRIAAKFENNGSWDFLLTSPTVWFSIVGLPGGIDEVPPPGSPFPENAFVDITGTSLRVALYDDQRRFIIGSLEDMSDAVERPIVVHGETVGWLVYKPIDHAVTAADESFRRNQNVMTFIIGLVAVIASASLAAILASGFLSPLRRIGGAIARLARGQYDVELPADSGDEIGELSEDVNHLALVLDRNESVRRNLMADLSHELRTPIAILRAELASMHDGVRTLDLDAVRSLRAEVKTLDGLVNDIHELSSSDAGALGYRMHRIDLTDIVNCSVRVSEGRRERRNIRLEYSGFDKSVHIMGDDGRINQLLNNLLENSVRYTDPGGVTRVTCRADRALAYITIEDSEPGVPDDLINQLFDRFFRARPRRAGTKRGSGLGLAICRNIIEAHRGSVSAGPSRLGGLRVDVTLPRIG